MTVGVRFAFGNLKLAVASKTVHVGSHSATFASSTLSSST
jgi:hypothetical protein